MKHILLSLILFLSAATVSGGMTELAVRDDPPVPQLARVFEKKVAEISAVKALMVKQTNRFRKEEGLEPVELNKALSETSQHFADFMARTKKYGHTADGRLPSERAQAQGYQYCMVSENIAYQFRLEGFSTEELAKVFVTGWKKSPEHRKNMVDPGFVEIGVGVAQDPTSGRYFAVQMFGRPKSMGIRFQLANKSGQTVYYTLSNRESRHEYSLPPQAIQTHERCLPTILELSDMEMKTTISDGTCYTVGSGKRGELTLTTGSLRDRGRP
ncbi:MAG: CAP domain-containing protein [Deltaproteobacteria bacterium]|nr:CAP domain-containing protein [Deltaproteobacteria bacterium]